MCWTFAQHRTVVKIRQISCLHMHISISIRRLMENCNIFVVKKTTLCNSSCSLFGRKFWYMDYVLFQLSSFKPQESGVAFGWHSFTAWSKVFNKFSLLTLCNNKKKKKGKMSRILAGLDVVSAKKFAWKIVQQNPEFQIYVLLVELCTSMNYGRFNGFLLIGFIHMLAVVCEENNYINFQLNWLVVCIMYWPSVILDVLLTRLHLLCLYLVILLVPRVAIHIWIISLNIISFSYWICV